MIAVTPMPPAAQTEINPRPEPFSLSSFAIVATTRAPVAPKGWPIATLPRGSEIDAEEEAYVKMALKHALDGQVERKVQTQVDEKVAALSAEQQALGHVAVEMQEARYRAYSERREQEVALRSTWAKQQQLKLMEATLDKAEAA